jgi:hypothetical protein
MRFARMGSLAMMFQWNGLIFVVGNLDGKSGVQILAVEKTNNGKEYLRVFHEEKDAIAYANAKGLSTDHVIRIDINLKGIAVRVLAALDSSGVRLLNFNGNFIVNLDDVLAFVATWPD